MAHAMPGPHLQALTPVLLAFLAVLLLAYLVAARRARRVGARWGAAREARFTFGVALLAVAVVPPMAEIGHTTLRGHMVQHLLLGMFAPLALALGAPGTLLLRIVPTGAARRTIALLRLRPVRCFVHPATTAVLDIGGMYLLYLTPLFAWSLAHPRVHGLVLLHFVLAGYLFSWSMAGPDPTPDRPGMRTRLAALFAAAAAHAILAKLMYGYGFPRGTPYDPAEIQAAAQVMYYGGDLAEVLLAVALFHVWFRRRSRSARPAAAAPAGAVGNPHSGST